MPRPGLRVKSLRKVKIKLPGGAFIIHYFKRRPSGAVCASCGKPLHGVPRKRDVDVRSLTKSQRKPERPYGGNLCPACSRQRIKSRLR